MPVRTALKALTGADLDRALDAGKRIDRKMTDPDDKVRPSVSLKIAAYPRHNPFFKVKAVKFFSGSAHIKRLNSLI